MARAVVVRAGGAGMYFNVSQLMRESAGATRAYETDDTVVPMDGTEAQHVRGSVRLLRTDKGIWLSAELQSEARCTCSRCLDEFVCAIRMTIEEEYFPTVDAVTGASVEMPEESEGSFHISLDHVLDASEAVRQYISLNYPMKPVCRKDCAGLCLSCGVNLNESPCECDSTVRDSRWGPLLELVTADPANSKGNS